MVALFELKDNSLKYSWFYSKHSEKLRVKLILLKTLSNILKFTKDYGMKCDLHLQQ